MRLLSIALVVATLAVSGCATILAGGPDKIPVQTNVPGASVYVDDVLVGQTPTIIMLDRQMSQGRIRIEAPGFQPVMLQRVKIINGMFWANICVGLVPMLIDAVTGDMKKFEDGPLNIALVPAAGGPQYAPPPAGYPAPAAPPYAPPSPGVAPGR